MPRKNDKYRNRRECLKLPNHCRVFPRRSFKFKHAHHTHSILLLLLCYILYSVKIIDDNSLCRTIVFQTVRWLWWRWTNRKTNVYWPRGTRSYRSFSYYFYGVNIIIVTTRRCTKNARLLFSSFGNGRTIIATTAGTVLETGVLDDTAGLLRITRRKVHCQNATDYGGRSVHTTCYTDTVKFETVARGRGVDNGTCGETVAYANGNNGPAPADRPHARAHV